MTNERLAGLRAYIKENSARGPGHAVSLARAEWQRLQALIADISEQDAVAHPLEGEWSISQVLQHLTLSHEGNVDRIAVLARGEAFPGLPPVPGALPAATPASFDVQRREFLALVKRAVQVIEAVDPATSQTLTADHPALGSYTWLDWATHMHFHARMHTDQIEQVKQALARQNQL